MSDSDESLWQNKVPPLRLGEAFATDITKLSRADLRDYIIGIKKEFSLSEGMYPIEFSAVLMLAAAEQNNRSTRRLMWTAIVISILGVFASIAASFCIAIKWG